MGTADDDRWWREGVLYQIYPRSFADADGDGIGDLRGVITRLDHLAWLGVRGVWLTPIMPSPNADWGYDVADYCAVDPALGTLEDLDALIAAAGERGIRVLLDLVPNHTSDEHPWFRAARCARDDPHRDFYVWADGATDGGPPNNWISTFGGPAWTRDERTGQWYLHNFLDRQPDLNWWNPNVRDAFDEILRFWFDRGVAGFRIDVAHMIVKDRHLRDNPPVLPGDPFPLQVRGQRPVFNERLHEVHDVHRRWRRIADGYEPRRVLVGETFCDDVRDVIPFYGRGDELHLAFNIPFALCPFEAGALRAVIDETEAHLPEGATPVWTAGNHDLSRFPTRWAGGDEARARVALMLLLTLRGCVFLYYGDEIGMCDTDVPVDRLRDPVGVRFHPYAGRDPERTPMPWDDTPGAGFTRPGVEPWLPFGTLSRNVAAQRHDPDSILSLTRDLIGLRDALGDLRTGLHRSLPTPERVLAYRRGERTLVALNLGDETVTLPGPWHGDVRVGTVRSRDGDRVDGPLRLGPAEGVVCVLDPGT